VKIEILNNDSIEIERINDLCELNSYDDEIGITTCMMLNKAQLNELISGLSQIRDEIQRL
jgi:hypothetical protein